MALLKYRKARLLVLVWWFGRNLLAEVANDIVARSDVAEMPLLSE